MGNLLFLLVEFSQCSSNLVIYHSNHNAIKYCESEVKLECNAPHERSLLFLNFCSIFVANFILRVILYRSVGLFVQ